MEFKQSGAESNPIEVKVKFADVIDGKTSKEVTFRGATVLVMAVDGKNADLLSSVGLSQFSRPADYAIFVEMLMDILQRSLEDHPNKEFGKLATTAIVRTIMKATIAGGPMPGSAN